MRRCLLTLVSGRVQGVGFRYYTRERAQGLGLTGYAENLTDGRVKIVAEGEEANLKGLLAWVRHGPPGADVARVELKWDTIKYFFPSFSIR